MAVKQSNDSLLFGALSYFWVLSIVILFMKRDDSYVVFHAKQGLVIFIATLFMMLIPILGWLVNFALFLAIVVGFIKALQGERYKLPVIFNIANKIKL